MQQKESRMTTSNAQSSFTLISMKTLRTCLFCREIFCGIIIAKIILPRNEIQWQNKPCQLFCRQIFSWHNNCQIYSKGRNIVAESALPIILMKKIERKAFKLFTDILPRDEKQCQNKVCKLCCRQKLSRMGNLTFNCGINYTTAFRCCFFCGNVSVAIIFLLNEIILQQEKLWQLLYLSIRTNFTDCPGKIERQNKLC